MKEPELLFEFSDLYKSHRKYKPSDKARFKLIKVKRGVYYVQRLGSNTEHKYHKDYLKPVN